MIAHCFVSEMKMRVLYFRCSLLFLLRLALLLLIDANVMIKSTTDIANTVPFIIYLCSCIIYHNRRRQTFSGNWTATTLANTYTHQHVWNASMKIANIKNNVGKKIQTADAVFFRRQFVVKFTFVSESKLFTRCRCSHELKESDNAFHGIR